MKNFGLLIVASLLFTALPSFAADPLITEFMPSNARVLADEDGQFPDWIEIHNPAASATNLQGWFLTDNAAALTKWAFPEVTLPAGGYLVVFASGKNRTADPAHLHTSFQLNADGGYLALVKPDGSNVVSAYNYPAVKEDVSYGMAQKLTTTSLLAASAPRILAPTNASQLPADWNQLAYVPGSDWTNGVAPPAVGFDTNQVGGVPVNVAPSGTAVQSTTYNGTAYPANLAINTIFSDFTHTASTDSSAFWQVTLTNEMAIYEIVLFNRGGGCCQWRLRDITVEIVSTNLTGPVTNWISPLLNPENVLGSPAYLSNNLVTLTGGPVMGRTVIVHRKADPDNSGAGTGTAQDDQNVLSLGEVVVTASLSSGLRPFFSTDIQNLMFNRSAAAFVRLPFVSTNTPDTLAFNVRYDDGFVAYLNGTEIARRNVPATPAFDSSATVNRALTNATTLESIDVAASIPLLVPGTNLLAVQMLNFGATNGDALLQPQLVATKVIITPDVYLVEATPGAINDTDSYLDEVADTRFSVDRGFFDAPFSLSITSSTPGAVIYYSVNADEPGPAKGVLYTGPITITNTTVLRARAFKDGWKATDVDTATYLFLGDVIYQAANWEQTRVPPQYFPSSWGPNSVDYGMDPQVVTNYTVAQWKEALTQIPSMSIVTEMKNLFDPVTGIYANASGHGEEWERPMSLELLDPTNAVPGRFQENGGLRIRGGFSRNPQFFKHSFRVFFNRGYGAASLKYPLFEDQGAQEFDKFDLRTSQNYSWPRNESPTFDTMVREVFCRETLGDMGQPYRRSRYYHLYLNGQYWGLYETDERPSASYGESYFGGSKTNYDVVKCGNRSVTPNFATEATDGNFTAWSNLWVMCQMMRTNASNSNYFRPLGCNPDGTRNPNLEVLLDVDNLIDYMLEIFYSGDGDATLSAFLSNNQANNWFGMRDRTNPDVGFRFFNSDCEHTLGSPSSQVDRTGPFGGSNEGLFMWSNPQWMHEELMRNAEYRTRFADHVQRHFFNGGALGFESCTNRFLAKANQITKAIRAYSARWGDAIRTTQPYGESDWTNALAYCLNWFTNRAGIVLAQLKADALYPTNLSAPGFSQLGGAVSAGFSLTIANTNGSGVVYFTTDGSDPRVVGGAVSGTAQSYSSPIAINTPMVVRARVLTGTNWSAELSYPFYPPQDLSKLFVTEIMYHPPVEGLVDGDEFEFLELKNAGASALNLSGLWFSGISFTFTNGTTLVPGQFFVLARNTNQFAARHPGVAVNGVYTGQLNNAGEAITLSHALGGEVLSVTYDDLAPWPVTPDGFGFSLVPVDPNANSNFDNPANWRASTAPGGSPGADDPTNATPPVLINEVLSHSETGMDFIELFNPTTNTVPIGGWFLTDDPGTPMKYRIPDGTTIGPVGYVVFDETHFNPTPGTNLSFSLNGRGDDVYLFSGDANTNLTGYSHGFSFGAAPDQVSFGRYIISTGAEQFPAQIVPTRGQPNAGPQVGPVVINEIMYHPDLGGDEFVELKNITASPVPLFDPLYPTNTWNLTGLGFVFPTNITMAPGGLLLLTPADASAFRTKYAVPAGVTIFGGILGTLQDSGERLELKRPDVPDTNGVAYVTVDEVRYNDKTPWPAAADGSGPSLQRKTAAAYGNDPANWEAAIATPGAEFLGGQSPTIVTQPQNRIALVGQTVSFSVQASGPAPLYLQWRFNGESILGATSGSLVLTNLQLAQAGEYSVVIFNQAGSALSAPAFLTVLPPVQILAQPRSVYVAGSTNLADYGNTTNATAAFTVLAQGNSALSYQWRFQGAPIPGATNSSLTYSNVNFTHQGNYDVVVTDAYGSLLSQPAFLGILLRPVIIVAPMAQTIPKGGTFGVSVQIRGSPPPFGYLWRDGSTTIYADVSDSLTSVFTSAPQNAIRSSTWRIIVTNAAAATVGGTSPTATFNVAVVADFDQDGLPDAWEVANGYSTNDASNATADLDGDGMSLLQEYTAGTDPTDPASVLKFDKATVAGGVGLEFYALSNRTYSVQYKDALSVPAWSNLQQLIVVPTNRPVVVGDPAATNVSQRLYRIAVPAQP